VFDKYQFMVGSLDVFVFPVYDGLTFNIEPIDETSVNLQISDKRKFVGSTTYEGVGTYADLRVGESINVSRESENNIGLLINDTYIIELMEIKEDNGKYYGVLRLYEEFNGDYLWRGYVKTVEAPGEVITWIPFKIKGVQGITATKIGSLTVEVV